MEEGGLIAVEVSNEVAKVVEKTIKDLKTMAWEWRMDWSDFDGRTLVHQVDGMVSPLEAILGREVVRDGDGD